MALRGSSLEKALSRWQQAGFIDGQAAERIAAFERRHGDGVHRSAVLLWSFGGLLLVAGVLLFVSAHWDRLSPAERFALTLTMVAGLHLAAALLGRFRRPLGMVLHAVGTAACGAGIFLSGQIFHLQEHWPQGFLLWALAAAAAWWLLGHWPQALATALLAPGWLIGEWMWATRHLQDHSKVVPLFLVLMSLAYLGVRSRDASAPLTSLRLIGAIALACAVPFLAMFPTWDSTLPGSLRMIGWAVAAALPLAVAALVDRRVPWELAIGAGWASLLSLVASTDQPSAERELAVYGLCLLGAMALTAWGIRDHRMDRINLGIIGFAVTVLVFYFATFLDKLGRAMNLLGLGLLFLVLGFFLAKTRKRIIERLEQEI